MITTDKMFELLALAEERRNERRRFLKMSAGGVATAGAMTLLAACSSSDDDNQPTPSPTPSPTPTSTLAASDVDVLNFALNLEYLEASYYSLGALGNGLPTTSTGGTGTQGTVTGGRQVTFTDPNVRAYMREIASDENAHVNFIRAQLGGSAVAIPAINLDGSSATGAFTTAAIAAGVITAGQTFDPYASDENFLIGGILLSDVGVTAYKGASTLISSKTVLEAAAGILAAEAYHTGLIRSVLYRKGFATTANGGTATGPANVAAFQKVSDLRDTIDGTAAQAGPPQLYADDDQGYGQVTINGGPASNIQPTDANGVFFGRTTSQVLNIVYQNANSKTAGSSGGGFFPAGLNGNIKTSTATP